MSNIEEQIISESRHQIIYCDDASLREQLFKSVEHQNPIIKNINKPMSVYIADLGPQVDKINNNLDNIKLSSMTREYLYFSICYEIVNKIKKLELDNKSLDYFLDRINTLFVQEYNIISLDELSETLLASKETYEKGFINYVQTGTFNFDISDMNISFMDIESFIKKVKKLINNDSYLCILLNYEKEISTYSMKSVNNLIASRINKNISIKLGTGSKEWKTYYTDNNDHIDSVHDYDIIYLDDKKDLGYSKNML